jgi:hypothetical protein
LFTKNIDRGDLRPDKPNVDKQMLTESRKLYPNQRAADMDSRTGVGQDVYHVRGQAEQA